MKRKLLGIIMCVAMITTLMAGCKKETTESTQDSTNTQTDTTTAEVTEAASTADTAATDTSSDDPVTINMFISMPEYADAINALIAAYKEVKPNVTINYETTQNDYPTLLKAKINSGDVPDIFSSTSGKEIGVYLDYSYNLADQPLATAMTDPVKNVMMNGDEVHGLAIKGNYFGLIYNKAIFEQVGITSFPQTFPELEAACEKLQAAGYQPFTTGYAEWWVFKHVFQHFLNAAQPDDVQGLVNSFIAGKAKIADYPALYNDFFNYIDLTIKYGDQKPLETDLSSEISAFGSGQAAIMNGQGAWVEADTLKIDPEIQIGFDGYPVNDDASLCKVISGSDQALRINKDSAVLQDVLDFINWWYTSDYGKSWFSDVAGVIPPIKDAVVPDFEIIKQGNAHVDAEGAGALGVVYSTDSFHQAFGEIMQSYIAGTITKDEACSEIETKWVELEGNSSN